MNPPINLLHMEDAVIQAMMTDQRFLHACPCLVQVAAIVNGTGGGCSRCKAREQARRSDAFAQAKMCIAGLRGDQLAQVKGLLNARQLRIRWVNRKGSAVVQTL